MADELAEFGFYPETGEFIQPTTAQGFGSQVEDIFERSGPPTTIKQNDSTSKKSSEISLNLPAHLQKNAPPVDNNRFKEEFDFSINDINNEVSPDNVTRTKSGTDAKVPQPKKTNQNGDLLTDQPILIDSDCKENGKGDNLTRLMSDNRIAPPQLQFFSMTEQKQFK